MKAQRLEKLERERESLERDFHDALVEALRECADGKWGLFAQNKGLLPPHLETRYRPESVTRLEELGELVAAIRTALGYSDLTEIVRLRELRRATNRGNALGEQRQARIWLDEIENTQKSAPSAGAQDHPTART